MNEQNSDHDKTQAFVPLLPGTIVSHYKVVRKIGAGGMGEVYLAEDSRLKRQVALKFLPSSFTGNEDIRSRFIREAQAVARLNHPNIVALYDVSEFGGRPFFVMEHVEGRELHHFCHDEPLPIDTVLEFAIQICQGIGEAHRAGIVHRDIKSTNILVDTKGRVRLLDFGLAAVAGDDKLTKTGSTLGTIAYMSPEQVSGREPDHRSDLFSFGVVLYELLAGRTPFRRENEGSTLRAIMEDTPEPLSRYKAGISDKLQDVVDKLLEKDREFRYQSAEGVIADLKRLIYDSQPSAARSSHAPVAPSATKKSRWPLVGSIAAALVVVASLAFWLTREGGDAPAAEDSVPMIVVLPFENLGSPDDEYFADGMTEEITSRLAGIEGLGVISRTSAMQYKGSGKNLREIGDELNVQYVLEGTVRWAKVDGQSRVRITPQLVRVSDDRHVWADNYEREIMQVFAVQEDIATQIVEQLGVTLIESDRTSLASRPTDNQTAYEFYLKGLSGLRSRNWQTVAEMKATAAQLDSAVIHDPRFPEAYAVRSRAYTLLAFATASDEHEDTARASFEKALELKPNSPQGRIAAGNFYNYIETDYARALAEFQMARSEIHQDAELMSSIAFVQMRQGKFDEAIDNYRRAADLDPLNPTIHSELAKCLSFARRADEAERSINRAIALEPTRPEWYIGKLFVSIMRDGRYDPLRAVIADGLKQVDTLQLIGRAWPATRYISGLSLDSLLVGLPWTADTFLTRFETQMNGILDPDPYYGILAIGHEDQGNTARATAYFDSGRTYVEKEYEAHPDDFGRASTTGLFLAQIGECDRALQLGAKAKELLSIEACHW